MAVRTWHVAAAYAGGVVGAGFASGQEPVQFFLAFGRAAPAGLALATFLLCLGGARLAELAWRHRTVSHRDLLRAACGLRAGSFLDGTLGTLLAATLAVMLAAADALARGLWRLPPLGGSLALSCMTWLILRKGPEAMLRLNGWLTGVLACALVMVCTRVLAAPAAPGPGGLPLPPPLLLSHWAVSALLYASYNLALSVGVFGGLGRWLPSAGAARTGGAAGGLVVGGLALLATGAIRAAGADAAAAELPLLAAAARAGSAAAWLYRAGLAVALVTTAVALAFAGSQRLAALSGIPSPAASALLLALALPAAALGLERLVSYLYPALGYLGLPLLVGALRPRRKTPGG